MTAAESIEHVDRVRTTLGRLRTAAAERHLDRISQLVLEALRHLLRKEQLVTGITIDAETYAVELRAERAAAVRRAAVCRRATAAGGGTAVGPGTRRQASPCRS